MPSLQPSASNSTRATGMETTKESKDADTSKEVLLLAGEGTRKETAAIKTLLACTDDALVEKLQATFAEHGIVVIPHDSFVARNHARLIEAGFAQVQRDDGETVLRKTMPVWDMAYAKEHIVDGVHVYDSDTAVIDVTMKGMVTLSIGDGRYDEPPVDANTPEGLGVLVDAQLAEPVERPMLSLLDGLRTRLGEMGLVEAPSPFPEPRRKFPRPR